MLACYWCGNNVITGNIPGYFSHWKAFHAIVLCRQGMLQWQTE